MAWDVAIVLDPDWNPADHGAVDTPLRLRPTLHRFSGGEVHVRCPELPAAARRILLAHRVNSSDRLLEVLLAADAIQAALPGATLDLLLPYVPYARQDRRMVPGDPLSIRVLAGLINACRFGEVLALDPHSDVTPAVIDRCRGLPVHRHVAEALEHSHATTVVIPDAGAAKRVHGIMHAIQDRFPDLGQIQAMKTRDVRSKGAITAMSLEGDPDLAGRSCLIVDDICDGGRTFLELSKLLRRNGAAAVHLYVTHGIFSHGLDALLGCRDDEGRIDGVYTTDSVRTMAVGPGCVQFRL